MPGSSGPRVAIVGGGPAGLMAAERARAAGCEVDVYERMGSVGRKFLLAGKGGLNLTHSERRPAFDRRYAEASGWVADWLNDFDAAALRGWARGLGVETFVGTSGRVFPVDLRAAPLLRGWVRRLRAQGVRFHVHHRLVAVAPGPTLRFARESGPAEVACDAAVLALGGASWPELGSDGSWTEWLEASGLEINPLRPANCGFESAAGEAFRQRWAGTPVKPVAARLDPGDAPRVGEFVLTAHGVEGSLVYAQSAALRERIAQRGAAEWHLDLAPGFERAALLERLRAPRQKRSLGEFLRRRAGLSPVKVALLHEYAPGLRTFAAEALTATIKDLVLPLRAPRPIAEAISTAGGVARGSLRDDLMVRALSGLFVAGEMLDWEAPTGGYLLTACFASGVRAGEAAAAHARRHLSSRA